MKLNTMLNKVLLGLLIIGSYSSVVIAQSEIKLQTVSTVNNTVKDAQILHFKISIEASELAIKNLITHRELALVHWYKLCETCEKVHGVGHKNCAYVHLTIKAIKDHYEYPINVQKNLINYYNKRIAELNGITLKLASADIELNTDKLDLKTVSKLDKINAELFNGQTAPSDVSIKRATSRISKEILRSVRKSNRKNK
jgi:hypothetical protein